MQETQVQFLGQEGPLEKEMATHSSIPAWEIPRTEEAGGLQSMEWKRTGRDWACMHAGRNINNLWYAHDTTLMAESKEELKSLLIRVKEESEKVGLKFKLQKTKIKVSGPIT